MGGLVIKSFLAIGLYAVQSVGASSCTFVLEGVALEREPYLSKVLKKEIAYSVSPTWRALENSLASLQAGKSQKLILEDDELSAQVTVKAAEDEVVVRLGETKLSGLSVGQSPNRPKAALRPLVRSLIKGVQERAKASAKPIRVTIQANNVQHGLLRSSLKERGFRSSSSSMRRYFLLGTAAMSAVAAFHGFPLPDVVATAFLGWFTYRHTGPKLSLDFTIKKQIE